MGGVSFLQTLTEPFIEAVGNAFTEIIFVVEHPAVFLYVMEVVPAEIPDNKPTELMVATDELDDNQGNVAAAVAEPTNEILDPLHTLNEPVIVGNAFIFIAEAFETVHPVVEMVATKVPV